jgi:hypothetical protein
MKPGSPTGLRGLAMKPEVIVIAGPSGGEKLRARPRREHRQMDR